VASSVARARRRLRQPAAVTRTSTTPARADGLGARLRYAFDNSLSRGPIALIGWLALLSAVVIVTGAAIIVLLGVRPEDGTDLSPAEAAWQATMRALDAGGVGGDSGWAFRAVMLLVTIGGLFILSTLIGVLTAGIEGQLETLRKGRSVVLESGHTLVLGWSPKVFTILGELAQANANLSRPRVVVLADRDKVEMEDEVRDQVGDQLGSTKVICRSGNPLSVVDLAIASPATARSIILLTPEEDDTDRFVLRALLALADPSVREAGGNHIVATLQESASLEVAEIIAGADVRLVHTGDLISRITAQTCRQSGLSVVYRELLDFDGAEIYFQEEPGLVGRTYLEAQLAYESATPIGVRLAGGRIALNPPADLRLAAGDQIIAIAEDDDTVVLPAIPPAAPVDAHTAAPAEVPAAPEHTLVIGWNARGALVLEQLDAYVGEGSRVWIRAAHAGLAEDVAPLAARLVNMVVEVEEAAVTRRAVLEALPLDDVDHVIILAEETAGSRDEADTDTLVTLLHLRDIAARRGIDVGMVTEVLDSRNRELLTTTSADDFIVSDQLISLLLAQVSENAELADVFTDLFDPEGSEIYLRPAEGYVTLDVATPFTTVVAAAAARGETALGYRVAALAGDPSAGYGVVVSPLRSPEVVFAPGDRIIVLSEG
jgi:voltage-gated potassium channel Kch